MLLKVLSHTLDSGQDYRNMIRRRRLISILGVLAGIVTIVVVLGFFHDDGTQFTSFLRGVYTGTGTGLVLIGAIDIVRKSKLLNNAELLKRKKIEEQDERQKAIAQKASSLTLIILIALFYPALLVSGMFSSAVFFTLLAVLCVILAVMMISQAIVSHRL